MDEVKAVFNRTAPIDILYLYLYIRPSGDYIPADLLGESTVSYQLELISNSINPNYPLLEVDPNAFRSSKDTLMLFQMWYLDTSLSDLSFLADFQKVSSLHFEWISNLGLSLPTIPYLPALRGLYIYHATGLNEISQAGDNTHLKGNGLVEFFAESSDLDANVADQLLDWILPNSAESLKSAFIDNNRMNSIPPQLSSFQKLESIYIRNNKEDLTLQNNSFFVITKAIMDLSSSQVVSVESGAFQGNFALSIGSF